MIIDSHCHLISNKYESNVNELIRDAQNNNVQLLLNISTKKQEFNEIIKLSKNNTCVYNSIGIHPHETSNIEKSVYTDIENIIKNNKKTIAVGETGLDFYYEFSERKYQIDAFNKHIELSLEYNLPLIIHSRSAENEISKILNSYSKKQKLKGIIHCFTGSEKFAHEMIDLGFYISFSGILTFNKSTQLRETATKINKERILIETDAPYLSPVPLRGKINQPSHIIHTLITISNLLKLSYEDTAKLTTDNFYRLFNNVSKNY